MRRIAIGTMAVAAVLFAAGLSAQGKPNFSGKWTLQQDPNAAAGGGGRGGGRGMGGGGFCGQECTITQDGNTLKIERAAGQNGQAPAPVTYTLDGKEVTTQQPGRNGGDPTNVVTKAGWDGDKITITTSRDFNGTPFKSMTTISMDGGNMVVETSSDRGQGPQPGQKQTYKKG